MGNDLDYQDLLDDVDIDLDGQWLDEGRLARTNAPRRDSRRAIEELREARRLRELLADYDDLLDYDDEE